MSILSHVRVLLICLLFFSQLLSMSSEEKLSLINKLENDNQSEVKKSELIDQIKKSRLQDELFILSIKNKKWNAFGRLSQILHNNRCCDQDGNSWLKLLIKIDTVKAMQMIKLLEGNTDFYSLFISNLKYCIKKNNLEVAKKLLSCANIWSEDLIDCLFYAIKIHSNDIAKLILCKKSLDLAAEDEDGSNVLNICVKNKNMTMLSSILKSKKCTLAIFWSLNKHSRTFINELVDSKIEADPEFDIILDLITQKWTKRKNELVKSNFLYLVNRDCINLIKKLLIAKKIDKQTYDTVIDSTIVEGYNYQSYRLIQPEILKLFVELNYEKAIAKLLFTLKFCIKNCDTELIKNLLNCIPSNLLLKDINLKLEKNEIRTFLNGSSTFLCEKDLDIKNIIKLSYIDKVGLGGFEYFAAIGNLNEVKKYKKLIYKFDIDLNNLINRVCKAAAYAAENNQYYVAIYLLCCILPEEKFEGQRLFA